METSKEQYRALTARMREQLRVDQSFDVIEKKLIIGGKESTFYFIDGFAKDTNLQQLLTHFVMQKELAPSAEAFLEFGGCF